MRQAIGIIVLVAVLLGGALLVMADGNDATPTAPAVGRRALTQGESATAVPALECEVEWFFTRFEPEVCPQAEPVVGELVMQRFEYGFMVWMQTNDMIYVMHTTAETPRWLAVEDPYVAGMPERDFGWAEPQPPQSEQPRLGFGALWREDDDLRARIGWAVQSWEFVYDGHVQVGEDGTIYLDEAGGGLFELLPDESDWNLYGAP